MTPALGKYADNSSVDGAQKTVLHLGGVQFTVIAAVLLLSTCIPKGAFRLNPRSGPHEEQRPEEGKLQEIGMSKVEAIEMGSDVQQRPNAT